MIERKVDKRNMIMAVMAIVLIALSACSPVATANPALAVDVQEAYDLREAGAFLLDVRQPEEWEAGHIPGATLIPLGELESRVGELPEDQQIVVVCRSGNRSASGRDILLDAGFTDVTSMDGGMNAWASAGYETVTGP